MAQVLWFVAGLAALAGGAELLVRGASRLALLLGMSPLVVGLTIVSFGTSAPEMAVAVGSALDGQTDLAIGNAVGSNILNVLLILGLSALIVPLVVHAQLIRQEVPIMIMSVLLLLGVMGDGSIGRADGVVMFGLLVLYMGFLTFQSRRATREIVQEYRDEFGGRPVAGWDRHWAVQSLLIVMGLWLLVKGSSWIVDSAVAFATTLGVSEVIIGLTIVSAGTSMPEVAASIAAAMKGERDIAVGNVVGSNIFNVLGCLGLAAIAAPGGLPVPPAVLRFDMWVMLAVSIACLPVFYSGREIARWEGAVFLGYYAAYSTYLILAAQRHALLPVFSSVMLWFAIPLTVLTLVVIMVPRRRG